MPEDSISRPSFESALSRARDVVKEHQARIRSRALRGDKPGLADAQKRLVQAPAAKLVAAWRVALKNPGRITPGVDGVCNLDEQGVEDLAESLDPYCRPAPSLMQLIPKKDGTAGTRVLAIPTMRDRAVQSLHKLALEPEWEERFDDALYGFRPKRGLDGALVAVAQTLHEFGPSAAYAGDIKDFFMDIDHDTLLGKLGVRGKLEAYLKALASGPVQYKVFRVIPAKGLMQGGPLSPLLANVMLNGLKQHIHENIAATPAPRLFLYADDFLILHPDESVVGETKDQVRLWLTNHGLRLNEKKGRSSHSRQEPGPNRPGGFKFLGCQFFHYDVEYSLANPGHPGLELRLTLLDQKDEATADRRTRGLLKKIDKIAVVTDDRWYTGTFREDLISKYESFLYPGYQEEVELEDYYNRLIWSMGDDSPGVSSSL